MAGKGHSLAPALASWQPVSHTVQSSATIPKPTALDPYIIGGLVLAALLTLAYIGTCAVRRRAWPDVGPLIMLVATSTAITTGVRLGVIAITASSLGPFPEEDRLFIPLAGVALILVALREIAKTLVAETARPRTKARKPVQPSGTEGLAK